MGEGADLGQELGFEGYEREQWSYLGIGSNFVGCLKGLVVTW